jgi:hypothetical protein
VLWDDAPSIGVGHKVGLFNLAQLWRS